MLRKGSSAPFGVRSILLADRGAQRAEVLEGRCTGREAPAEGLEGSGEGGRELLQQHLGRLGRRMHYDQYSYSIRESHANFNQPKVANDGKTGTINFQIIQDMEYVLNVSLGSIKA